MLMGRSLFSIAALFFVACAALALDEKDNAVNSNTGDFAGSIQTMAGENPDQSGFYPLISGIDALAARVLLAERAEHSIDAQYYFLLPDVTGRLFLHALFRAAERGVHVRLLLDDIHTKGHDASLAALHAHPNINIRLYNPFTKRSARWLDFIVDLPRVNRRMHKKSFTVDRLATIVGGRNIGDEYFDAREDFQFGDIDLLGIGPIANEVSSAFDEYWESDFAAPMDSIIDSPQSRNTIKAAGAKLQGVIAELRDTPYAAALESTLIGAVEQGTLPLYWAEATTIYDPPGKTGGVIDAEDVSKGLELGKGIERAESEFLAVSPYFVPQQSGVEFLRRLRERYIRVAVITNSLASTDVSAVHSGYAKYRKDLLRMGVELWEASPEPDAESEPRSGIGYSRSSLHAKLYIVDRRYVYVGSLNWDPRSLNINSELGIVVDSPALAEWMAARIEEQAPRQAYRLRLADAGRIEWLNETPVGPPIYYREPGAGFWRRLSVWFLGLLPIEGQL